MTNEHKEYPQVRVTRQARAHLDKLIPAERERRGLNVSMTDVVSELILSQPIPESIPQPTPAVVEVKRRTRKAEQAARVPAL